MVPSSRRGAAVAGRPPYHAWGIGLLERGSPLIRRTDKRIPKTALWGKAVLRIFADMAHLRFSPMRIGIWNTTIPWPRELGGVGSAVEVEDAGRLSGAEGRVLRCDQKQECGGVRTEGEPMDGRGVEGRVEGCGVAGGAVGGCAGGQRLAGDGSPHRSAAFQAEMRITVSIDLGLGTRDTKRRY